MNYNFSDTAVWDKDFNNTHFIRGWSYGGEGRNLDEAMNVNYYLIGYSPDWNHRFDFTDSTLYIKDHERTITLFGISASKGQNEII